MSTEIYFRRKRSRDIYDIDQPNITNLKSVLFSRGQHFVGHIHEVMIKILNEITHRPYLPYMNFHLTDIEVCTAVTYHVLTNENKTF